MKMHDNNSVQILFYVQGELRGVELAEFSCHLDTCVQCQARVKEERTLSRLLRQINPLYTAPEELRARVAVLLTDAHSSLMGDRVS